MSRVYNLASVLILLISLSSRELFGQSFNLNGTSSYLGGICYELTANSVGQVGSIFSNNTVNLNEPFTIEAVMNFGTNDGTGADGIVFILSTNPDALGGGGGGIGYVGITPSLAVEFDTYQNTNVFDPVNDHMAFMANGSVTHTPPGNLFGPVDLGNIENGQDYCFLAIWDPNTQTLIAGINGYLFSYSGNIINGIFGGNTNVHYGFSSATGLATNRHTICVVPIVPEPMEDVTICPGESIQLQADINGYDWTWEPDPSISNPNISNPTVDPVSTTEYIVAVEYVCGAVRYDTVVVTVNPDLSSNASNTGPECEGENITLNSWGGDLYNWSGPLGFDSDDQNPILYGVTPGNAGTYVVTITDDNGCTYVANTTVQVYPTPVVDIIDPAQPFCEDGDAIQLNATPPGGNFDGEVTPTGLFNPVSAGVGDHAIEYFYTDGNNCSASDEILLTVVPNISAAITPPGPFCEDETLVTLSANPSGGIWGGIANASGQIFPNTLSPGMHTVTYELTTATACYNTEIEIEIVAPTILVMPDIPDFCDDDPDYQITGFDPPGGTWSGAASASGIIDPQVLGAGTYQVTYTYDPPVCPVVSASATFSVFDSPNVQNIERICDATATTYFVQFEITGGDPSGYNVQGSVTGNLDPGNPAVFTSDDIPTGANYSFFIFDDNNCDTVVVSGSYSCNCVTSEGNMNQTSITACEGESITVPAATGYTLDPNDEIIYVLHTGNPFEYLVIGNGTTFEFEPPVETGITYFIDALIGNSSGNGVDLSDPCLAITSGPTVMWQANPTGYFTAPADICDGDEAVITFFMTGVGPFDITYLENNTSYTIEGVGSPYSITVTPVVNTDYTFVSLTDAGTGCSVEIDMTTDIAVGEAVEMELEYTICQGESIFLEGEYQTTSGVYYDTFPGNFSCDTFVISTLTVITPQTTYINSTSCHIEDVGVFEYTYTDENGCDSMVIATITYADSDTTYQNEISCDPAEVGVYMNSYVGENGCDSTVITTVTLTTADTTHISGTSCIAQEVGVFINTYTGQNGCDSTVINTITYSEGDTTYLIGVSCNQQDVGTFINNYTAQNGCDSIVISTITLTTPDTTYIATTTCNAQQVGVFTNTYAGQNSCDSVVISTITLITTDTSYITGTTCDAQQVGVFTNVYTAQNGCDSTVISTITLTTSDTSYIYGTTCDEQQVGVFTNTYAGQNACDSTVISTITLTTSDTSYVAGTTCDEQQAGVFTNTYTSQNGCDSTVISTITLTNADTSYVMSTTCDEQQVGVFTNTYTGQNGCDSTVISTVTLTTADTFYIAGTTCNEQQVGVFTNTYTGQNGCDSTVVSTITLTTADTSYITGTTCSEQQVGVFTNTYTSQNGCDSTVVSTITFSAGDTSYITGTTCDELQVGVFTNTYSSQNGCDSTVVETLSYLPIDTMYIVQRTCKLEETDTLINIFQSAQGCDSTIITHIRWDEDYTAKYFFETCLVGDTGKVVQYFDNVQGCDSIVITLTSLSPVNGCGLSAADRERVFVPNAITPNHDGINDDFYVMSNTNIVSTIQWLRIYDRWGGLVAEKLNGTPNDPGFGWDGTREGAPLGPGVYIWQVHFTYSDGIERSLIGDVTLVR